MINDIIFKPWLNNCKTDINQILFALISVTLCKNLKINRL